MVEITMAAGENLFRDVYVWDDLAHTLPHDITDSTIDFELLDRPGGLRVEVGGAVIVDAETGHILVVLEPSQTFDRVGSVLHYVVTLREAIGTASIIDSGKLRIVDSTSA